MIIALKDTLNWWQGVGDEFVERSLSYYLGYLYGVAAIPGLGILTYGVLISL